MNTKLVGLINDWNPVQIYPLLEDEYFSEIKKVESFINNSTTLSVEILAIFIDTTFFEAFGEKVYISNMVKCIEVSAKILGLYEI